MKKRIEISIERQTLVFFEADQRIFEYPVSTAKNGVGESSDSYCTPRGAHQIGEKIGDGVAINTVFVGRQPTGEIYHPGLRQQFPERDWILTRILWLEGCEAGFNKGGSVDTKSRHIYIHGSPDEAVMGSPHSQGCVRMRNTDIVELFAKVSCGTQVYVAE